jgi:hypothetical protein
MRRVKKCSAMRIEFCKNLDGENALFFDIYGDSIGFIGTTKKEANVFAKYLRESADFIDEISKKLR